MLWSLLKVLIFVSLVAGLTWGADALLASGQGLRIAIAGMEFTLGPLQAVVLVLALVIALWFAMALVGLLVARSPSARRAAGKSSAAISSSASNIRVSG